MFSDTRSSDVTRSFKSGLQALRVKDLLAYGVDSQSGCDAMTIHINLVGSASESLAYESKGDITAYDGPLYYLYTTDTDYVRSLINLWVINFYMINEGTEPNLYFVIEASSDYPSELISLISDKGKEKE